MSSLLRVKEKIFYGWVVVASSLIIGTVIWGIRFSFGVFFKSIESKFGLSRMATSGVFSVYTILYAVFGVLGGWVLDKYGPRTITFLMGLFAGLSLLLTSQASSPWQLFISYSLLLGVGTGATYIVLMSTTARWFEKKRGLAMGIVGAGSGVGMMAMAPFASYLISNFGWQTSNIIMGLIAWLVVIPLSMLLKRDPSQIGLLTDGVAPDAGKVEIQAKEGNNQTVGFSLLQASRTRSFWLLWLIWLMYPSGLHLITTHIVPRATDIGISAMEAAVVISMIGGSHILGTLLVGKVSDNIGRKVPAIFCAILQAGAMALLIWAQDLWVFYLFAVVYGLAYGGLSLTVVALVGDIFGLRNMGIIMGILNIAWGVGSAVGPFIGGFIFDATNSYATAFLLGTLTLLLTALLLALIRQEDG